MTTKFTNSHKTSFSYFSHYEEKRRLFTDAIQSSGKLDRWQRIPTVFIIHLVCIKSSHDEYLCKKYVYVAYIYIYTTLQGLYIDMNSLPSLIGFWGRLPFSRLAEVKLIFAEHLRLGGTPKIRDDDGMTDGI